LQGNTQTALTATFRVSWPKPAMNTLTASISANRGDLKTVLVENLWIRGYLGEISLRVYQPLVGVASQVLPGVVYLHGGGFVAGSVDAADLTARTLAAYTPARVISVGYSLAPQHPFPAAPEDAYAALQWLADHAERLHVDRHRIAVAGDDAGGNLAAALSMLARDRNGPAIAAQVLLSPMLDPSMTQLGDAEHLGSDLKPKTCANGYFQYLPNVNDRLHPYASPLTSRRLHGLPTALIITAECDVLHREAELYASALITAGVPTQITRFSTNHADLPTHPPALAEVIEFLQRRLVFTTTPETRAPAQPHKKPSRLKPKQGASS